MFIVNRIVGNQTVFDIENVITLNRFVSSRTVLTFNCVQTKLILLLNSARCKARIHGGSYSQVNLNASVLLR